jgi:hypothetical protein
MSELQKKPGWAFWATVVVVVALVAYPLSSGPVVWLYWNKLGQPGWMKSVMGTVYAPLEWTANNGPDWLKEGISSYCRWWRSLP